MKRVFASIAFISMAFLAVPGQQKPIIFAVLHDGGSLEPVAYVDKNKLVEPVNGSDEPAALAAFSRSYFKKGTAYKLIFGGTSSGTSTVKSHDPKAECSKNIATATTKSTRSAMKGFVMGLATNAPIKSTNFFRRRPTAEEKTAADDLAKAEYARHKLTPKVLRYHNLTAVDVDNDGSAELIGSYWVEIDSKTRGLLFFIAAKANGGKYSIGFQEYRNVDQGSTMSGEIKSLDEGVYHELLLDVFDYDGDGTSEVFTYVQSFEGAGFNAYKRSGGKWSRVYEFSNYHCAF